MDYIWDKWLPKLASKDRFTDVRIDRTASTTRFSDMLGFPTLSARTAFSIQSYDSRDVGLATDNPTPLSSALGWSLLAEPRAKTELMTDSPYPLSARMGWKLLSKRKYFSIAAHAQ